MTGVSKTSTTPPGASATPNTTAAAAAAPGATAAAAEARGPFVAIWAIEGRRKIAPGETLVLGEFSDAELDRLISHGAIANAAEVEAERMAGASAPNPVNFVLQFLRAKQPLKAWVLGERDYRIAAGKVFLASASVSEPGFLAGFVELVGRPTAADADAVFSAYRGRAADLFALWGRAGGTSFFSQRTDFLSTVEPAPAELPAAPTLFVGRDPTPPKPAPDLPGALTARPRHLG